MIKHFDTCNSIYPEKPEGEAPQVLEEIRLGDSMIIRQCVDCGACEEVETIYCCNCGRYVSSPHSCDKITARSTAEDPIVTFTSEKQIASVIHPPHHLDHGRRNKPKSSHYS